MPRVINLAVIDNDTCQQKANNPYTPQLTQMFINNSTVIVVSPVNHYRMFDMNMNMLKFMTAS